MDKRCGEVMGQSAAVVIEGERVPIEVGQIIRGLERCGVSDFAGTDKSKKHS